MLAKEMSLSHVRAQRAILEDVADAVRGSASFSDGMSCRLFTASLASRAMSPDGLCSILACICLLLGSYPDWNEQLGSIAIVVFLLCLLLAGAVVLATRKIQLSKESEARVRAACSRLDSEMRECGGRDLPALPYHHARHRVHIYPVYRSGKWNMLPSEALARGDLIVLAAGEVAPAAVISLNWADLRPAPGATPLPGGQKVPEPPP